MRLRARTSSTLLLVLTACGGTTSVDMSHETRLAFAGTVTMAENGFTMRGARVSFVTLGFLGGRREATWTDAAGGYSLAFRFRCEPSTPILEGHLEVSSIGFPTVTRAVMCTTATQRFDFALTRDGP